MRRRTGLGVSIEDGCVRLACVRKGSVQWLLESSIEDAREPWAAVAAALATLPHGSLPRAVASGVVLSAPHAQVRVITGLPSSAPPALANELVSGSPQRWFLLRAGGLHVSTVERDATGIQFAAALSRSTLDGVRRVLETSGARVRFGAAVAPPERVSPCGTAGRPDHAHDGSVLPAGATGERERDVRGDCGTLTKTPERERTFAAAIDAARGAAAGRPPRFTVPGFGAGDAHIDPKRARRARVALLAAIAAAILAWPTSVLVTASRHDRHAPVDPEQARGDSLESLIRTASREVDSLILRTAATQSVLRVLDNVRRALPREATVVAFRLDSTDVQLTVVGARVGSIADALAATHDVHRARIVGAVTTEALDGALRERATIAFSFRRELRP